MTNGPEFTSNQKFKIIRDFIEIKNFMQASNGNKSTIVGHKQATHS